jgi:hypothetical protein
MSVPSIRGSVVADPGEGGDHEQKIISAACTEKTR